MTHLRTKYKVLSLIKVRNEELIIKDTLDYLSHISDGIVILDDASTDKTLSIIKNYPDKILSVLEIKKWSTGQRDRLETVHRQMLLAEGQKFQPEWFIYHDADERIEEDVKSFLLSREADKINGIKVNLYDAYITPEDKKPFRQGGRLFGFRKYFGPEKRQILMIFRNLAKVKFIGIDSREPAYVPEPIICKFNCQHYGKSLSIKHWEETCDYYINYFPQYAAKWNKRKGKAIHTVSDFGNPLYNWHKVKALGYVMPQNVTANFVSRVFGFIKNKIARLTIRDRHL